MRPREAGRDACLLPSMDLSLLDHRIEVEVSGKAVRTSTDYMCESSKKS